jgi:drug/metabolite transporter (DMT)-like permease
MGLTNVVLIMCNAITLVIGQFLWKIGLERKVNPFESMRSIIELIFSPFILGGLVLYGLTTILWLYILSRAPISVAYPMQSVAYLISVFGAYFIFGESLSWMKVMGCLVILIGVAMVGFSTK